MKRSELLWVTFLTLLAVPFRVNSFHLGLGIRFLSKEAFFPSHFSQKWQLVDGDFPRPPVGRGRRASDPGWFLTGWDCRVGVWGVVG